jgi:hypothetical protein
MGMLRRFGGRSDAYDAPSLGRTQLQYGYLRVAPLAREVFEGDATQGSGEKLLLPPSSFR